MYIYKYNLIKLSIIFSRIQYQDIQDSSKGLAYCDSEGDWSDSVGSSNSWDGFPASIQALGEVAIDAAERSVLLDLLVPCRPLGLPDLSDFVSGNWFKLRPFITSALLELLLGKTASLSLGTTSCWARNPAVKQGSAGRQRRSIQHQGPFPCCLNFRPQILCQFCQPPIYILLRRGPCLLSPAKGLHPSQAGAKNGQHAPRNPAGCPGDAKGWLSASVWATTCWWDRTWRLSSTLPTGFQSKQERNCQKTVITIDHDTIYIIYILYN